MKSQGRPKAFLIAVRCASAESVPGVMKIECLLECGNPSGKAWVKHPAAHERFAKEAKPQSLAGTPFRTTGLGVRGVPEPRVAG